MSFSTEVKTELASLTHLACCDKAELSALFHIGGSVEIRSDGMHLVFQTTNNAVARKATKLIKEIYHADLTISTKKQTQFKKRDLFLLSIHEEADQMVDELSLFGKSGMFFRETNAALIEKDCCKRAYLRGAFLAGGSVNSPDTSSYHMEIQTFSEDQALVLVELMKEFQLGGKVSKNKRGYIAYVKEAERIADFLRVVGATNGLFAFEDSRIKRDFKNSINRVINCDIANEKKAMDAAQKQLDQIDIIEKHLHGQIPTSMKEAIFLRKTYPESTLFELSYASIEHYGDQISKSALNHRFRAIKDLALKLQIEEETQS